MAELSIGLACFELPKSTDLMRLRVRKRAPIDDPRTSKMPQDLPPVGGYEPVQYKVCLAFIPFSRVFGEEREDVDGLGG